MIKLIHKKQIIKLANIVLDTWKRQVLYTEAVGNNITVTFNHTKEDKFLIYEAPPKLE